MKTAVVTGFASGVGAACAKLLSERGWRVIGLDKTVGPHANGVFEAMSCDVTSADDVERTFGTIGSQHNGIDALVCSAGVLRVGPVGTMAVADYDAVFNVNTRGSWLCARAALPLLKAKATQDQPSRIVFISSVAMVHAKIGTGIYAASKAAVSQFTRVLAAEAGPDSVLVNAIAPGSMDTPMTRAVRVGVPQPLPKSGIPPLGRYATPDDVAASVAMLLGDDARFITGVTLIVDGGATAAYVPGN